jgi:hypothetical protein
MVDHDSAPTAQPAPSARPTAHRARLTAGLVVLGFAALALRFWFLVGNLAVSVPYWDQWDFLDGLFRGSGWKELFFWQHGPHRQGLAGIVYALLFPLTDWSARAEAFVAWSAIVVGAVLCLWIKLRLEGRIATTDLFIALAFFSISSFELFLGAQNLAHGPLPIFLVCVAALLVRSIAEPWRLALLVLVADVATFTGFGLALAPPLAVALAIELRRSWTNRHRRIALFGALLFLALGWVAFLRDYRWLPASDCLDQGRQTFHDGVVFVGAMVGRAWGVLVLREKEWVDLRIALGFVLFALLAATAIRAAIGLAREDEARRERWRTIFLLSGFSLLFVLLNSAGRSCLGLEFALSSRYTIYSAPGMVGVYLWAIDGARRARAVAVALLVLLLAAKELRSGVDARQTRQFREVRLAWVDCYRQHRNLDRCDRETGMAIFPASGRANSRIEEKLRFLESHRLSLFSPAEDLRAQERLLSSAPAESQSGNEAGARSKRGNRPRKKGAGRRP